MGLDHVPSGQFDANGARLAIEVMAHNVARWSARIGLGEGIITTRSARTLTLHLRVAGPGRCASWPELARPRAIAIAA